MLEFAELAVSAGGVSHFIPPFTTFSLPVVPPNVLQVLPGSGQYTGKSVTSNPLVRKVDITVRGIFARTCQEIDNIKAGTATGRALGRVVGSHLAAYTAELGGKAPIIVFDDADLESAVNGAAFACFVASGQTCVSGTRLVVQAGIYDEFMERFLEKVESIRRRMGNRTLSPGPCSSDLTFRPISM